MSFFCIIAEGGESGLSIGEMEKSGEAGGTLFLQRESFVEKGRMAQIGAFLM